ncbi:MAG: ATP-dependent sacrificial sulfur transferase LarE [Clostridiales bacterium]|jgi:uncharacterized protein|nr:ATP-dependent sacrificial sulfur transferase LarE [Clostridiales bacterium]
MDLKGFFYENPSVALGFSGGVDSSYLLYAALQNRADVNAYFVKTRFQPEFELNDAYKITQQQGVNLTVIEADVFNCPGIIENPENRCYLCKKFIFSTLKQKALQDGYDLLIDGTNASDDYDSRPGMKALKELSVRSPLREAGLTKQEIRHLSKEAGLFTWGKPAYACLATRIPVGMAITKELLHKIELSENALSSMGFTDFRVRVIENFAKLQLQPEQLLLAINNREKIINGLKPYFDSILVDLAGR